MGARRLELAAIDSSRNFTSETTICTPFISRIKMSKLDSRTVCSKSEDIGGISFFLFFAFYSASMKVTRLKLAPIDFSRNSTSDKIILEK